MDAFRRGSDVWVHLGDGLDLQNLETDLRDGVLTVRILVAEQAKPRKVGVGQNRQSTPEAIETSATAAPSGRAMRQPQSPRSNRTSRSKR